MHDSSPVSLRDVSRAPRRALAKPLAFYLEQYADPKQGMAEAYHSGAHTMCEIGEMFAVHEMKVSRAVQLNVPNC